MTDHQRDQTKEATKTVLTALWKVFVTLAAASSLEASPYTR
jgi:hypothetical protein